MATPPNVVHLEAVGSTQDEAASRFDGQPLLVTATHQDAGRGRAGVEWLNADRTLAASLAMRPEWPSARLPTLTLVAGLAVLDVLPPRVALDWPNDVVVGDEKVGGLLTEMSDGVLRVGFGLNVFWEDPPVGMAAMHDHDPGVEHVRTVAERWGAALVARVVHGPDWGRDEYAARCRTLGRRVTWEPDGAGTAVGIGPDGALLVHTADGPLALRSGEVRRVRAR